MESDFACLPKNSFLSPSPQTENTHSNLPYLIKGSGTVPTPPNLTLAGHANSSTTWRIRTKNNMKQV